MSDSELNRLTILAQYIDGLHSLGESAIGHCIKAERVTNGAERGQLQEVRKQLTAIKRQVRATLESLPELG